MAAEVVAAVSQRAAEALVVPVPAEVLVVPQAAVAPVGLVAQPVLQWAVVAVARTARCTPRAIDSIGQGILCVVVSYFAKHK